MKANRMILMMVVFMAICLVSEETLVEGRKSKGNVRYSNRAPRKPQLYKHPQWMDDFCFFMDSIFDWFGYTEIPQSMRYSFILTIIFMPVYAFFFFWCCLHNDEYDDEIEEELEKGAAGLNIKDNV